MQKRRKVYECEEKPTWCTTFNLVYFVNLYMFRAYLRPSSGGTTLCIPQLVLIIIHGWTVPIQPGQQTVI